MAWPSTTVDEILSGKGAKTLGQDMYNRQLIAAEGSWSWVGLTQNVSSDSTLTTEQSGYFRFPTWAESTSVVTVTFVAKRGAGVSGDCQFRIRARKVSGSWTDGTTLTTAITTSWAPYDVVLAVPASPSWAGELVECAWQAKAPAGFGGGAAVDWQAGLEYVSANMRVAPA